MRSAPPSNRRCVAAAALFWALAGAAVGCGSPARLTDLGVAGARTAELEPPPAVERRDPEDAPRAQVTEPTESTPSSIAPVPSEEDAVATALHTAAALAEAGDHRGALRAIDQGLAATPGDLALALARARLLRDQGALRAAAEVLDAALLRAPVVAVLQPAVRARLLLGEVAVARAHLEAAAAWPAARRPEPAVLGGLQEAVAAAAAGRPQLDLAELRALARGAEAPVQRARALRTLAEADPAGLGRALDAAAADPEASVRRLALRLGMATGPADEDWLRGFVDDQAPMVRAAAAVAVADLERDRAVALLLDVLDSEENGYVFRQVHDTLSQLAGSTDLLPMGAEEDPAVRRRTRARWREFWGR